MKNIAIIPARSGSKGLKDKNIKLLNGKPLIWHSIQAAIDSDCFDEVMVSTDSEQYAYIARECGASVPFLRSIDNSNDAAGSWDVVKEVLSNYQEKGKIFDTVCLLQPTSPLRKAEDIILAYKEMEQKNIDSVTSVCEVDHSPLWTMALPEDNSLNEFRRNQQNIPRQKLPKYYRLNGAVYIRLVEYDAGKVVIKDDNEHAYIMSRNTSVDIDTQDDFDLAEFYMKKMKCFEKPVR